MESNIDRNNRLRKFIKRIRKKYMFRNEFIHIIIGRKNMDTGRNWLTTVHGIHKTNLYDIELDRIENYLNNIVGQTLNETNVEYVIEQMAEHYRNNKHYNIKNNNLKMPFITTFEARNKSCHWFIC